MLLRRVIEHVKAQSWSARQVSRISCNSADIIQKHG